MNSFAETLESVGKRPGMWFGRGGEHPSLELVEAFVTGYQQVVEFPDRSLPFSHFTRWVAAHYHVSDGPKSGFVLIREHVGGDDRLAFDEFFRLLPGYVRDMTELGPEGIQAHYAEVMSQLPEET